MNCCLPYYDRLDHSFLPFLFTFTVLDHYSLVCTGFTFHVLAACIFFKHAELYLIYFYIATIMICISGVNTMVWPGFNIMGVQFGRSLSGLSVSVFALIRTNSCYLYPV